VNTDEQNLKRQLTVTCDYTEDPGAMLGGLEIHRNKLTESNTPCDGYESLMNDIEAGDIDVVVAKSVRRELDAARPSGW
jgi:hypothetical protein